MPRRHTDIFQLVEGGGLERVPDDERSPELKLSLEITNRLSELGLSMAEWRRRSKVSDVKLREMRDGTRPGWSPALERAAERALGWAGGSFESVRDGLNPELLPDPSQSAVPVALAGSGSGVDMGALSAILGPLVEAVDRQTAALRQQNERIEQVLERLDEGTE
jgi:nucleotide-binding universal stress UspA family protein